MTTSYYEWANEHLINDGAKQIGYDTYAMIAECKCHNKKYSAVSFSRNQCIKLIRRKYNKDHENIPSI